MRRWAVLAAAVFLVSAAAGVLTGASISLDYWGYVISRPPMFAEIGDVTSVRRFTEIAVSDDPPHPAVESTETPAERRARTIRYYEQGRLGEDLRRQGLSLASVPAADATLDVPALIGTLRSAGILVEGDPGYERSSHRLSGAAIEFGDAGGRPLLLVSLGAGEVANDHYPRYEVLLTRAGSTWQIHRWQRYFLDIAGVEFLEGPVLFILASVVCTSLYGIVLAMVTGSIAVLVLLVRRAGSGPSADQARPVPQP